MPAITLGYSQIEQQIRNIRRRRNWLTLQQAMYSCGSVMLLGVALLIVLAIRGQRLSFTLAFWATLASIVVSAVAAARSIWRRWVRAADTPRWIDRVAHLDDRLATLVAHHGTPQPPRLMSTVVSQLFALRYRWEPAALVPRRVPRSIYLFIAAVIALIATAFVERPPAAPQKFPHAKVSAPHPQAPADADGSRVVRVQRQRDDGGGHDSGAIRGAEIPGARGKEGRGRNGRDGTAGSGRSPAADRSRRGSGAMDAPPPALPERVQDMIRQALSHPPLETQQARAGGERAPGKSDKPQGRDGKGGEQQQARAEGMPNRDAGQTRPNAAATPPQQATTEGSRGTSGGGGAGQGSGSIFGQPPLPAEPAPADKGFALKLVLLGQSSRATMEPQKSKRGGVPDVGNPSAQPGTEVPLNPEQRADEPLVRGEIPAEHEAMIKRIFSRPE